MRVGIPSEAPARPRRRRSGGAGAAAALLAVLVVLVTSGCQVRLTTDIRVDHDGSGVVRAGVGLDDEALAQLGDPSTRLRTADLREAGWTVGEPAREADGLTWVRISKPFSTPEEGTRLAAQLGGPRGPFRAFEIVQTESLWRRTTTFEGVVDLADGLRGLTDPEVVESLGGDLGLGLEALRERFGESLGEVVRARVTVQVGDGAPRAWTVVPGEVRRLEAEASRWNASAALPAIVSLALAAAALLVVWRARR